jgi:hypothetical protein
MKQINLSYAWQHPSSPIMRYIHRRDHLITVLNNLLATNTASGSGEWCHGLRVRCSICDYCTSRGTVVELITSYCAILLT